MFIFDKLREFNTWRLKFYISGIVENFNDDAQDDLRRILYDNPPEPAKHAIDELIKNGSEEALDEIRWIGLGWRDNGKPEIAKYAIDKLAENGTDEALGDIGWIGVHSSDVDVVKHIIDKFIENGSDEALEKIFSTIRYSNKFTREDPDRATIVTHATDKLTELGTDAAMEKIALIVEECDGPAAALYKITDLYDEFSEASRSTEGKPVPIRGLRKAALRLASAMIEPKKLLERLQTMGEDAVQKESFALDRACNYGLFGEKGKGKGVFINLVFTLAVIGTSAYREVETDLYAKYEAVFPPETDGSVVETNSLTSV